jgi:hypothetical protein
VDNQLDVRSDVPIGRTKVQLDERAGTSTFLDSSWGWHYFRTSTAADARATAARRGNRERDHQHRHEPERLGTFTRDDLRRVAGGGKQDSLQSTSRLIEAWSASQAGLFWDPERRKTEDGSRKLEAGRWKPDAGSRRLATASL